MERLTLIQLSPDWRLALLDMARDYQAAGEERCQSILAMNDEVFFAYLRGLEDEFKEENLPVDIAPQTTYWLTRDDLLVGYVNIRHRLTPALEQEGGNINYTIRPSERGKGYGKQLLALAIQQAASLGLETALVTCEEDNPSAISVIEGNGGELIDTAPSRKSGKNIRRYRISINPSAKGE